MASPNDGVATLRTLPCVRDRCRVIFDLGKGGSLQHFRVNMDKLGEVVDLVQGLMDRDYASYDDVPYHSRWRHFEVGGLDRVAKLRESWACDATEEARRLVDLVIVSVLLDAGAGDRWRYREAKTGLALGRSEGLGVASFHMFAAGAFSSDPTNPHRVDSAGLKALPDVAVRRAFQAEDEAENPLVGCKGRTEVLQRLGVALEKRPEYFEGAGGTLRPGNMVDYLLRQGDSSSTEQVPLAKLWEVVMYGLESMWPAGRTTVDGQDMGDVWHHGGLPEDGTEWGQLVPFHKLSQWMTYSLMEPLQAAGLTLTDKQIMTGLPEYRNGGLLLDVGLLEAKHAAVTGEPHHPHEEVIVEWRALTVCLLDEVARALRDRLGKTEEDFPLVKVLEGGTWKAGRVIARERRPDTGAPPIQIISDGTVF